jgi:glycosyltransferase involved in cell wall biosynthesis
MHREVTMTSTTGEQISVCLLTYNHAHIIESTVASIQQQSLSGYEIIISDDCSTDGTWEKVVEIAETDPRIIAIQTPKNCGMPGNANYAVDHARRSYIALLHHDDIYRYDLLEKWSDVLDRHPDVAFVFNQYHVYGTDFIYPSSFAAGKIDGIHLLKHHLFATWGCAVRGTAMIRRDAWLQVGGMREQFNLLADIDLWMRLAMRWNVGYVAEPVMTIRSQRPANYAEMYSDVSFSWPRKRYLYKIHATNRLSYYDLNTMKGAYYWWVFRVRLNLESIRWLAYAVVRKRKDMISSCRDGATSYDLLLLRIIRTVLLRSMRFI